jgi:hypothetical protein
MLACGIALWAMPRAPVALVAALPETSVLFALFIARGLPKERVAPDAGRARRRSSPGWSRFASPEARARPIAAAAFGTARGQKRQRPLGGV